jgi:hypothetical protein
MGKDIGAFTARQRRYEENDKLKFPGAYKAD